jgi:hypothetical protein
MRRAPRNQRYLHGAVAPSLFSVVGAATAVVPVDWLPEEKIDDVVAEERY